jgi:hypothetical protein
MLAFRDFAQMVNQAIFIGEVTLQLLNEIIFNSRVYLDRTEYKMVSNLGSLDATFNLNFRLDFYLDCRL